MRVNPDNMLFEDMSSEEAGALYAAMEALVLKGTITPECHVLFETWRLACGFDDRQGLLVMSTVLPQRGLLSVLRHHGGTK